MNFIERYKPLLKRFSVFGHRGDASLLVFRCDGTCFHGGMCDRFNGIVSSYAFSKAVGRKFRIIYNFPFDLTDFLLPNEIDWRPGREELCSSIFGVELRKMFGRQSIDELVSAHAVGKQMHVYANRDYVALINDLYDTSFTYGGLFNELFRLTDELQCDIEERKRAIGSTYVAVAFRFQNLLGDFEEYGYHSVSEEEQKELIDGCLTSLRTIRSNNPGLPIVVTADSSMFLDEASHEDGVVSLRGHAVHCDKHGQTATHEQYKKSFIDFFMLAGAQRVYSVAIGKMYRSGFPLTASLVGGVPFSRL